MSLSLVDINSTVFQSAAVAGGGLAAHFIDNIFPEPRILTSTSQVPLVAAELVGQIALNGITVKLLGDFVGGWSRNTSMVPLLAACVFPLVQPRLMRKLFFFYNGLGAVMDTSMAKRPITNASSGGISVSGGHMYNNPGTNSGATRSGITAAYTAQPANTTQIADAIMEPSADM